MATALTLTHDWSADMWDWPLQHHDGVVKVHHTKYLYDVALETSAFKPNEISASFLVYHSLKILCWQIISGKSTGCIIVDFVLS